MTVAAGSRTGVFNSTTGHAAASTQVTITATFKGTRKTAVLTVTTSRKASPRGRNPGKPSGICARWRRFRD
jgi:hypothetical protein